MMSALSTLLGTGQEFSEPKLNETKQFIIGFPSSCFLLFIHKVVINQDRLWLDTTLITRVLNPSFLRNPKL